MLMLKPWTVAAVFVAAALLFAGCGSSKKATPPDTNQTTPGTPAQGDTTPATPPAGGKTGAETPAAPAAGGKIGSGTMTYPKAQKDLIDQSTKLAGLKTVYVPEALKPEELDQTNSATNTLTLHYKQIEIIESTNDITLGPVTAQQDVTLKDGTAAKWVNYTTNVDGKQVTTGALLFKIGDTNIAIGGGKPEMDKQITAIAESMKQLK